MIVREGESLAFKRLRKCRTRDGLRLIFLLLLFIHLTVQLWEKFSSRLRQAYV